MKDFRAQLAAGLKGEDLVKAWLRHDGHLVVSDFGAMKPYLGPRVYGPSDMIIQPDLLAIKEEDTPPKFWVEVKSKSVFSWHRITAKWTTGVDVSKYDQYLEIINQTGWDVLIVFLHFDERSARYGDAPWPCPTGLFWQWLDKLETQENHRWGNMVYWAHDTLNNDASIEGLIRIKQEQDEEDRAALVTERTPAQPLAGPQLDLW